MKHGPTARGCARGLRTRRYSSPHWARPASHWRQPYQQAPMLDAAVADGELPPVDERLPETPYVETMIDGVGKYGGTIRTTILANGDHYNLTRTIANELLVRWKPDWSRGRALARRGGHRLRRRDDLHLQAAQGPEVDATASPSPSTTSCSGTKTCSMNPELSPTQEPDLHRRGRAGGGDQARRGHRRVQVRLAPTASSCSSSPTARATCRSSTRSTTSASSTRSTTPRACRR